MTQKPVDDRQAETTAEMFSIARHPAFRIGFLDALNKKPIDHDRIIERIFAETPPRSLERIGYQRDDGLLVSQETRARKAEFAQYRYEEGRLLQNMYGLRCRAWRHPDFPPRAVVDWIMRNGKRPALTPPQTASTALLRSRPA